MSEISTLFVTRLYRAKLDELARKKIDTAELLQTCYSVAEDDEAGGFFFHDLGKKLCDAKWLHIFCNNEDRTVRTHSECSAQCFLRLIRSDRDGDDFRRNALFLQTDGFFHRDFVEGVHRHLHVGQIHARAIRLHAGLHIIINDPLYGHKDLHGASLQ